MYLQFKKTFYWVSCWYLVNTTNPLETVHVDSRRFKSAWKGTVEIKYFDLDFNFGRSAQETRLNIIDFSLQLIFSVLICSRSLFFLYLMATYVWIVTEIFCFILFLFYLAEYFKKLTDTVFVYSPSTRAYVQKTSGTDSQLHSRSQAFTVDKLIP